jgi:adenylate cyclase
MMLALANSAMVHYFRGEIELAAERAEGFAFIAREHSFRVWAERAGIIPSGCLVEQGRIDEGIAGLEEVRAQVAALGAKSWYEVLGASILADAYGRADRPDKGLEVLASLEAIKDVTFYRAEVERVRGELLLMRSPRDPARGCECLRQALDLAAQRGEKSLELRAATSLARAVADSPLRKQAQARLAAVYVGLSEGTGTADLRAARALLDELGG